MNESVAASQMQLLGAGGFGVVIGWMMYFINRYRKANVELTDLATIIGIVGGGAILAIFPARTDLFGAFGIGLFLGFFSYFLALIIMVAISPYFGVEWFLDGRRTMPTGEVQIAANTAVTVAPMGAGEGRVQE